MSNNIQRDIERQVGRVRRRMIAQELVRGLAVGVTGGLLATTGWLLASPFVSKDLPTFTNRAVLGGALALGGVYAVARALLRRPTTAKSALWLDSEFQLGERVTTSLALSPTDAATPAGVAVLNDTHDRVKSLRVRDRFPVRMDRTAWLVPSSAAALALVALFYDPALPVAQGTTESKPLALADKTEIDKKLEALTKPKRDPVVEQNRPKSEELKQLEAKLEEIARQPRENTQQLRERVKDMTPLEDEIKKLERQRSEKAKMLQQQLQMKDQLLPSNSANDGPAKDFMKALSEGDMDKGREELEKLTKRIAKNELSEKEKEQLGQQMKQLEKKMSALAQQKQKEELLKKLGQDGKLDPEALERELAQLKKENENLKDLKKLAEKMGECQQCVKSGDLKGAEKAMGQAADQLKEMARDNQEL
ncbi:MAG: hypothetical protein K1X57_14665, partial [Gemmataceae bacterium]|nr:hypothetical protein [Gemmataceae bacterium]